MKQLPFLFIGTVIGTCAIAAHASEQPVDANEAITNTIKTVVVSASRDKKDTSNVTGNIAVINQQQINETGATHINELMSRVPGAWVSRGNGQEHLTAIRSPVVTGAGSCAEFVVAEDNVPTRPRAFCNVNELFEVNTEQAERIEVIRGPGNAFYGSGAVHGVINVISAEPPEGFSGNIGMEAGPHDYYRSKASVGDTNGKHAWRFSVNGTHDGGYKDSSGFDQQKMSTRYDYHGEKVTVRNYLTAVNLNQQTAGYVNGQDAYKDEDRKKENANPDAYRDGQAARFASSIEIAGTNDSKLVVTPYLRWADMDFLMHFQPGTPVEQSGFTSSGVQTAFYQHYSDVTDITSGFDVDYSEGDLQQFQENIATSQRFPTLDPRFPRGDQYDYTVYTRTIAPYIQVENALTQKLTMTSGVRWESAVYGYHNALPDGSACDAGVVGCRYFRPDSTTERFYDWSPKWGLRYDLTDNYIGYVNLARGHRAPQTSELFRLESGQSITDISSEEIDSIEFGVRGGTDVLSTEVDLFGMHKRNVIFKDANRQNVDNAKTKHYGIEISALYAPVNWFDVEVAATYARHRYANNESILDSDSPNIRGNDIDTAPRNIDRVQLGFNPWHDGRIAVEWLHMGKYYLDPENTLSYPGHDLANIRMTQKWMDLTFGLRIINATNEDYAERADVVPLSNPNVPQYFIGEPRSYYFSVDYNF